MTIELDSGHWALLLVIGMLLIKQGWTAYLVMKERDTITNKMLAVKGDGVLDNYVAGVRTLEEPIRKEPTLEEAIKVVEDWEESDSVMVD